jgi:hypothetical protein
MCPTISVVAGYANSRTPDSLPSSDREPSACNRGLPTYLESSDGRSHSRASRSSGPWGKPPQPARSDPACHDLWAYPHQRSPPRSRIMGAAKNLVVVSTFTSPYKPALRLRNNLFPLVQTFLKRQTLEWKGGT